jgi:hypothetical protein
MKHIEKFLIVILILSVVSIASTFFSNALLIRFYGPGEYATIGVFSKLMISISLLFKILVHICVAIWLFTIASEHKAQPWAWFVFGVFFGLMAAILFYLVRIYETIQSRSEVGANSSV